MNLAQLIAALSTSGAVGAGMTALFRWFTARKKADVAAVHLISKAAVELLEPMREDLHAAREEINNLRHQVAELSTELESTRHDLRETRVELQFAQAELRRLQSES